MPLDLFTLKPLAEELNELLAGGRVDKITQPEADEIRLFLRAQGKNRCLVISANPQAPRCHLTVSKRANPLNAPAFLMLLRKHLAGAVLTAVGIYNEDRVVKFTFLSKTEMLDQTEFHIYAELMNRYSNIVLTDADDVIMDAVKHIPLDAARDKCVLRGVKYRLAPQDKSCFLSDETDTVINTFCGTTLYRYMQQRISGFAAATVNEVLFRAETAGDAEKLTKSEADKIKDVLNSFRNIRAQDFYLPCVSRSPKDFMPMRYLSVSSVSDCTAFPTLNEAA
ncbi:MAG: NFACT family protein, partial [Clostridiales bacterium]|nr:NFACT family protein [Clostridiales bacterium]